MKIYRRNISIKLFLIRLIIIVTPGIIIYSLFQEKVTIALTLAFVLLLTSLLKINGLIIHQEGFFLQEYYLFGLKQREWLISKNKTGNLELFKNNDIDITGSTGTWLDIIVFPALFMSGKKGILIKGLQVYNKTKNKRVFLNTKELDLITNMMKQQQLRP